MQKIINPRNLWVEKLFDGLPLDEFWSNYFDKRHYHFESTKSSSDDLVTILEIETVLHDLDMPIGNLDLGREGKLAQKSEFSDGIFADRKKIWDLYSDGYTIIFRKATRWLPRLRAACRDIASKLFFDVQANIYLTPSGNFSAPPHFDTHHIFVVQIMGEKRWEIFDCDYSMPRPHDHFEELGLLVGDQADPINMQSGSVLYMPRGLAHRPVSLTDSVHVSLSCSRLCMADYIALLCDYVGRRDARVREHIPIDRHTGRVDLEQLSKKLTLCQEIFADHSSEVGTFLSSQNK